MCVNCKEVKSKRGSDRYRVEVGVVLKLEHIADDVAVGGVEASLAGSPKGLKNVFH